MYSIALLTILLLPLIVFGDVCPSGYTRAANGGDCFRILTFYDSFTGIYTPTSFSEAEIWCNSYGGGLLTSIRSDEDTNAINKLSCNQMVRNIGLKCKGIDCKWDDGSPLNYTHFQGDGPKDDGKSRCYTMKGSDYGAWSERNCGEEERDCWVCRVKAKTVDCVDGETEYRGGCVSIQSTPLDHKTATESCPGGGHLVTIHSGTEINLFKQIALDAGVIGSIYIGGEFSNGVFVWADKSYVNYNYWATGFPNTIFGTCVQMLLDAEFGVQGQWTNIDCSTKQPSICFRDGAITDPSAQPKADLRCPPVQYYTGSGNIFSPNYPLSIPGQQSCEYVIGTMEDSQASVTFLTYDCQSGTTLSLFDGFDSKVPFKTFSPDVPSVNQTYSSSTNVIKMVFSANGTSAPIGTGWEAEFSGITP